MKKHSPNLKPTKIEAKQTTPSPKQNYCAKPSHRFSREVLKSCCSVTSLATVSAKDRAQINGILESFSLFVIY